MSCRNLRLHITAWSDGNLEPRLVAEVQKHLSSCASCGRFYQEQMELADWLRAGDLQLEPPHEIWQRIEHLTRPASELACPPGIRAWVRLFYWTEFRYILTGLVLLFLLSAALVQSTLQDRVEAYLLAELESYSLPAQGNPFWNELELHTPFFTLDQPKRGNPFIARRDLQ